MQRKLPACDRTKNVGRSLYLAPRHGRQSGERTRPRVLAMAPSSSRTFLEQVSSGKVRFLSLRKSIAARAPQSAREGAHHGGQAVRSPESRPRCA